MILAGVLDIEASEKAARFVRMCDAFNIPIVTLVDVPGFLPGTDQEYEGIIRHGAKLLYAYCESTVPLIQIITRKAYGGAYVVMSSKSIGADLAFAWPTAELAVMGPNGAVEVVYRTELNAVEDPEEKASRRAELIDEYTNRYANPYIAAERGYVDDVIDPAETRKILSRSLEMLSTKREELPEAQAREHAAVTTTEAPPAMRPVCAEQLRLRPRPQPDPEIVAVVTVAVEQLLRRRDAYPKFRPQVAWKHSGRWFAGHQVRLRGRPF